MTTTVTVPVATLQDGDLVLDEWNTVVPVSGAVVIERGMVIVDYVAEGNTYHYDESDTVRKVVTLNDDGTVTYRGYTLAVSTIQVHVWQGSTFIDTIGGESGTALAKAKKTIDDWQAAR